MNTDGVELRETNGKTVKFYRRTQRGGAATPKEDLNRRCTQDGRRWDVGQAGRATTKRGYKGKAMGHCYHETIEIRERFDRINRMDRMENSTKTPGEGTRPIGSAGQPGTRQTSSIPRVWLWFGVMSPFLTQATDWPMTRL
jgi:hypothetical protein